MDYISALDANGNVQKLATQVVDTDKKSSIVTVNNQLEQPLTYQELLNAINSGLLNQEVIDAIRYGLATEATLANFVQSLTVTGDGLLVKFAAQNYYPEIQSVDAIDLDIRDLNFTSDKVDVSGSNITVDGQVELGSTTLTALENITVTQAYAATSTLSNVTSSTSSTKLLDANNNRKTAIIYNDSTSILYVCLNASVASITNYSFKLQPDGNTIIKGDDYSGEIRGIWASANGFARVTEVV